jgi:hypothetical protein
MRIASSFARIVCVAVFAGAGPLQPAGPRQASADDKVVWGLELVLRHVDERKYSLPKGDFILLSEQPMGIVSETIVYDFTAGEFVRIPGTHDDDIPIFRLPLSKEKAKLLRAVVALDGVKTLARESGNVGLDGSTFAAIIKIGGREQRIDQWQGDAPGLELLGAIRDREVMAVEHELNRRENAKRREAEGK